MWEVYKAKIFSHYPGRGSAVKLKDTFLDNKSPTSKFVCCTVDELDHTIKMARGNEMTQYMIR